MKELILAVVVSLDVLVASVTYGAQGIRIPWRSGLLLSLVSAGILGLSLGCAGWLGQLLPSELCRYIGAGLLCGLGVVNVFQSLIKSALRRAQGNRWLRFSCGRLQFVLEIYLDETRADRDGSSSISCGEAVWMGLAFSFDALACGLGAGLSGLSPLLAAGWNLLLGVAAIAGGTLVGIRLGKLKYDFSFVGGVGLAALGVLSLLG